MGDLGVKVMQTLMKRGDCFRPSVQHAVFHAQSISFCHLVVKFSSVQPFKVSTHCGQHTANFFTVKGAHEVGGGFVSRPALWFPSAL